MGEKTKVDIKGVMVGCPGRMVAGRTEGIVAGSSVLQTYQFIIRIMRCTVTLWELTSIFLLSEPHSNHTYTIHAERERERERERE